MSGAREYLAHYRQTQRAIDRDNNPHQVIALLLAGAIERVRHARNCLRRDDVRGRTAGLNGALDIIEGLRLSLDHDVGGEIADRLEALYEYMTFRLVEANLHNDETRMTEVVSLLAEIESAWAAIATRPAAANQDLVAGG